MRRMEPGLYRHADGLVAVLLRVAGPGYSEDAWFYEALMQLTDGSWRRVGELYVVRRKWTRIC